MEALVKLCNISWGWSSIHSRACHHSPKQQKCEYLWQGWSYFICLLHVVTYPWKWQCYHVALVGYGPAYPKFSKITNCQYPWKGLSGFVDFFHAVIWILSDIHWSYKNRLFWAGIVRHRLSANQIVRYALTLKTRQSYEVSSWVFASIEATKNILSWVATAKYSWSISFQDFLLLTCSTW